MEADRKTSQYCSPLRYPGGKACIYPFVSRFFRENELIGTNYAEPYAGGAGLALKLLFNEFVNKIFINDFDPSIYNLWMQLVGNATRFCDWLEDVEVSVDQWRHYKNIQENPSEFSSLEWAKSTYFLNRTNISGVIKGGIIGGVNQRGKYKINARFNKSDLILRIQRIAQFKSRIKISNLDGLVFINRLNKIKEDMFIYLDPPYVQKGADLYMNYYTKKDHEKLSRKVQTISKKWMVSYDDQELILNLYDKRKRVRYKLAQSASNRVGDEILIFSDKLLVNQSISSLRTAEIISQN